MGCKTSFSEYLNIIRRMVFHVSITSEVLHHVMRSFYFFIPILMLYGFCFCKLFNYKHYPLGDERLSVSLVRPLVIVHEYYKELQMLKTCRCIEISYKDTLINNKR